MNYHSQNNEAAIVLDYFKGRTGMLLDIGANDGITFSNTYDMILQGWQAHLLEPSPRAFTLLQQCYRQREHIHLHNIGIATTTREQTLYESGSHIPGSSDVALVSTVHAAEKQRWKQVQFTPVAARFMSFETFWQQAGRPQFRFITIDCEGSDYEVLQQIDLGAAGCECLCIEHNSRPALAALYRNYCTAYGMKQIAINAENILFAL